MSDEFGDENGTESDNLIKLLRSKIYVAMGPAFFNCLSKEDAKPVSVVTLFGKCDRSQAGSALACMSPAVSLDPFRIAEALCDVVFHHRQVIEKKDETEQLPNIEAVYVAERSTLVLVVGLPVSFFQLSAPANSPNRQNETSIFRVLSALFSLSHVVVCADANANLPLRYLTIFKALWQAAQKTSSMRSDVFKKLRIFPNNVVSTARLCVPRLLLIFDCRRQQFSSFSETSGGSGGGSIPKKIREMRHALEDQVYRILRQGRIVHPNNANKGLLSIPNNEEFVAVIVAPDNATPNTENHPPSSTCVNPMLMSVITGSAESQKPQSRSSFNPMSSFTRARDFIFRHVESLQGDAERASLPNAPFMTSLRDWVRTFVALEKTLSSSQAMIRTMDRFLFVNSTFAESLCKQALESAKTVYADGLPRYYSVATHDERLEAAKEHFLNRARISVVTDRYIRQLETYCSGVFSDERRLCERVSIFGSVCTLPLHRTPAEALFDDPELMNLPIRQHVCNIISKAACNCGRIQADRDDPFTSAEANYEFYQNLEEDCCHGLLHMPFVVTPRNHRSKRGKIAASSPNRATASFSSVANSSSERRTESVPSEAMTPAEQHSGDESVEAESLITDQPPTLSTHVTSPSHSSISPVSPSRGNPVSFWSLLSLGSFAAYSLHRGLAEYSGFVNGACYLYPIGLGPNSDPVTVGKPGPAGTPTFSTRGQNPGGPGARGSGAVMAPAVVAYIGVEFECPKGHRFFIESPEKAQRIPLNAANSPSMSSRSGAGRNNPPEPATSVALCSSDVPLFFSCCQCPSKAPSSGQLMRLYVLIPPQSPSSVAISMAVRVQASRDVVFSPLHPDGAEDIDDTEIPLAANNLWVLRFPLVYTSKASNLDDGQEIPILPVDHADYANFRLHANFLRFHTPEK